MSLDQSQLEEIAETLYGAYDRKEPVPPVTDDYEFTVEEAYEIQSEVVDRIRGDDGEVVGHKLGLVSEAKQQQLGIEEPIFGYLTDEMVLDEPVVRSEDVIAPRIEAEVGFVMDEDLEPPVTTTDVLAATRAVVPVVEIIESRYQNWDIPSAQDVIADITSSRHAIVGEKFTDLSDVDLAMESVTVSHNGELAETGVSADIMGNPARAVTWLGNRLPDVDDRVREGELVMSGGITAAIDMEPGDVFTVRFANLGSIDVRMK